MIGRRMLMILMIQLGLGVEMATANPLPVLGPVPGTVDSPRVLRLRPWRVALLTMDESPVAQSAGVVGEGGEIILSQGSSLPWNSFAPPAADRAPAPAPTVHLQPLSVQILAPVPASEPVLIGSFNPAPAPEAPAPAPQPVVMHVDAPDVFTNGMGILVPPSPSTPPNPTSQFDAFLNFGSGPYPAQGQLTTGDPQPWYTSPVVQSVFGNRAPTAEEQASFTHSVVEQVRETYLSSGLDVSLTTDPNAAAAHTMSVVANASYPGNDRAIGIANLGGDGFTFIDGFGVADTLAELETSVAKNIAHELMHTFGVDHQDTSGEYLDAAVNRWDSLFDPNTTFGPSAVAALASKDFQLRYDSGVLMGLHQTSASHKGGTCSCQMATLGAQAVPEPTTIALWTLGGIGALVIQYRRRRRA